MRTFIAVIIYLSTVDAFSQSKTTLITESPSIATSLSEENDRQLTTYSFSVPLINARPKPRSFIETFVELWNDPRPVGALLSADRSKVGQMQTESGVLQEIPYCIVSDDFEIEKETFQILLYPKGRVVSDASSSSDTISGPASAYLRYLPKTYGDEIDIAWKLQLCIRNEEGNDLRALSVSTSGGLPKSKDTWSAAMTFCSEFEAVESVGRATDWGSSIWSSNQVCAGLGSLVASGEITVFETRSDETSFAWPPFTKGAIGAVAKAATASKQENGVDAQFRDFRVGEVIVPTKSEEFETVNNELKDLFVYPGIDYRVMTMTDKDGNQIFSTKTLPEKEKSQVKLALRPCGWKLQHQLWKENGMTTEWPVEVPAEKLSEVTLTRFNAGSALPRIIAAFQRDWKAYTLALTVAIMPIPLALIARTFVSFYVIPSASMDPTLLKGDVLLVEKLPGAYGRTRRGDVVMFQPPSALRDIVTRSGSQLSSTSLFVKRIVGTPGDENIRLVEDNEVTINGKRAVGPNRNLCPDEPLRLIDRLLETGKGKYIDKLGKEDVYVLGDCKAVSVDSRVFGTLPKDNIVGKPVARLWPLDRIQLSGRF